MGGSPAPICSSSHLPSGPSMGVAFSCAFLLVLTSSSSLRLLALPVLYQRPERSAYEEERLCTYFVRKIISAHSLEVSVCFPVVPVGEHSSVKNISGNHLI